VKFFENPGGNRSRKLAANQPRHRILFAFLNLGGERGAGRFQTVCENFKLLVLAKTLGGFLQRLTMAL